MFRMYEYQCQDSECQNIFEYLTADDNEKVECPVCEYSAKRVLSATPLGFLNNDAERRKNELKRRSLAHTRSEQKKGNLPTIRDLKDGKLPKV